MIASRADRALPLARLRARGELVEIRAAELRFTPREAAAYLNDMMGLQLAAADVDALEGRTEGWIAALQQAALSMQGRDDVAGFIAGFSGDDRYIVDYPIRRLRSVTNTPNGLVFLRSLVDRVMGSEATSKSFSRLCGERGCDVLSARPGHGHQPERLP